MFTSKFEKLAPRTVVRNGKDVMNAVTSIRSRNMLEDLFRVVTKPVHATDECVSYVNDVSLIFNQQRLDKQSLRALSEKLDMLPSRSPLAQLRKKMSDEQLHRFVKSRYCQSMSELEAYSKYLEVEFNNEYERIQADVTAASTTAQSTDASSE